MEYRVFFNRIEKMDFIRLVFFVAGDILLLFVADNASFFLAGLSAFLIAHIFYIFFFHALRVQENIKGKVFLLVLVFIYYAVLMTVLSPGWEA
ncbi:MAG: lysoplasmalogenase family protein [Bacteroidota bacterium]